MEKRVVAEDKTHDANEIMKHSEKETWREKHASDIIIHKENKKAHDIMEYTYFMMEEYLVKRRYHQRGVDLLVFFHKNERQLEKSNHEKVVSQI